VAHVFALLVGIDEYRPPLLSLKGCLNDIEDVYQYLGEAVGAPARVLQLRNADATRAAVIDAFRRHLGRAGPGDSALFWYSGHGSVAPVPPQWWHLEPDGTTMQTLVCADSRHDGVPDLLDKELALLIREVASHGPHVAVVLDCCHAGGATRTPPSARARQVAPAPAPPHPGRLTDELGAHVAAGVLPRLTDLADHVALAACQSDQLAHELPDLDGRHRGVFTAGILSELRRLGKPRTYRDLVAAARGHVANAVDRQTPVLYPAGDSIVDQNFLGGPARPPAATMTMGYRHGRWVVDAGACHGLVSGAAVDIVRLAVHGSDPVREARVVRVEPDRCVVEPIDWRPTPGDTYPVVLSHVALPEVTVVVGGAGDDPEQARRVAEAIRSAGPAGSASPHVRLVADDDPAVTAELVVGTPGRGDLTVSSADGVRLASVPSAAGERAVSDIVARLEHIARWRRIRDLRNPVSRLADLVRVEVIVPEPHEDRTPRDRVGLRPGPTGAIELRYVRHRYGYAPPSVYIRLDNAADRPLYCVLLNLTDRFRVHATLFPGDFIGARASAAAAEGDLVEIALPDGRAPRPGARVRDWLMLVVSEDRIVSDHFALPGLAEPVERPRAATGLVGVVERLALAARWRDLDRKPGTAKDWWTSVTEIVTSVPDLVGTLR